MMGYAETAGYFDTLPLLILLQLKLNKMYRKQKLNGTSISVNNSYEGESIIEKVERIVNNKEPINDTAPRVYTERKEGVRADTDIRTDRFEVALEAMDKVSKGKLAQREARVVEMGKKDKRNENDGGAEPVQATT